MSKKMKEEELNQESENQTPETGEDSIVDKKESAGESKPDELSEMKDRYLRLYSEFENFRRRTAKERLELTQTANQDLMTSLLPILDDFDRALKSIENENNLDSLKEGVLLVNNKLKFILEQKGLKVMESCVGKPFDAELHEAITQTPAPTDDLKGKIIDELEKGYYLNDKIIRFAKVVIGQ